MIKHIKNICLGQYRPNNRTQTHTNSNNLATWFLSDPNGRNILTQERNYLINNVSNIYGNYSLQLAVPEINLLQGNIIANHYVINRDIITDLKLMAFGTDTIDLIICPHVLELHDEYNQILRELYRILRPNGKIIFICFNKHSLFSLMRGRNSFLRQLNFVNLHLLKSQLRELNFVIDGGKFINYLPICKSSKMINNLSWLDKIGDRWFPVFSNVCTIIAHKEVVVLTPIIKEYNYKQYTASNSGEIVTACQKN